MNIFPLFQTILYAISTALLYPVMLLLILLCLWLLMYSGGFAAEWIKRTRFRANGQLSDSLEILREAQQIPPAFSDNLPGHIIACFGKIQDIMGSNSLFKEEKVEDLIQQKQAALLREVDKIRLVVRIGPSLGLMGTLIPMVTGLADLTKGNMTQLSSSLIVAFTTTVVGLALGIGAHFFSVVKERWAAEDLRHIGLMAEALAGPQQRGKNP